MEVEGVRIVVIGSVFGSSVWDVGGWGGWGRGPVRKESGEAERPPVETGGLSEELLFAAETQGEGSERRRMALEVSAKSFITIAMQRVPVDHG